MTPLMRRSQQSSGMGMETAGIARPQALACICRASALQ